MLTGKVFILLINLVEIKNERRPNMARSSLKNAQNELFAVCQFDHDPRDTHQHGMLHHVLHTIVMTVNYVN